MNALYLSTLLDITIEKNILVYDSSDKNHEVTERLLNLLISIHKKQYNNSVHCIKKIYLDTDEYLFHKDGTGILYNHFDGKPTINVEIERIEGLTEMFLYKDACLAPDDMAICLAEFDDGQLLLGSY